MRALAAWFVRNPVAANLLMFAVVAAGLATVGDIRREVVPEVEVHAVSVVVPYPGASPDEVEEAVCIRIEDAVSGLDDVDEVRSVARESLGIVTIELLDSADDAAVLDDVRQEVDAIDSFPDGVETPIVGEVSINNRVETVVVWGDADHRSLRRAATLLEEAMEARPNLSRVVLVAEPAPEIVVEADSEALDRWRLSFDEIAAAVSRWSADVPGGLVRHPQAEMRVRVRAQAHHAAEIAAIPLRARPDGTLLRLGEVCSVREDWAETDQETRFQGRPAVLLDVYRVGDQDALAMQGDVLAALEEAAARLPEGIHVSLVGDETEILHDRLGLMIRNGRAGLLLVLVSLALFLRLRLAAWVTIGIPISFLGALALMPSFGVSINLISLFAFILCLGIVVDDAIVVAENVHDKRQQGVDGEDAAIQGVSEVAVPVVFAVLTTIAAFVPMSVLPGPMGQYARNIPLIVIAVLTFSLVESLLVLPSHLRHLPRDREDGGGPLRRLQRACDRGLRALVARAYAPTLEWALRWRWLTLALAVLALVAAVGWAASGRIRFNFFPVIESDWVSAEITMPLGTPPEVTRRAVLQYERAALELQDEWTTADGRPLIRAVRSSVGGQPFRDLQRRTAGGTASGPGESGGHLGEVWLELLTAEERDVPAKEIAARWRERAGEVVGARELLIVSDLLGSDGDVDLELSAPDPEGLVAAAEEVRAVLDALPGVVSTQTTHEPGRLEVVASPTPFGAALGVTAAELGRFLRTAYEGAEVQEFPRERDTVTVRVRLARDERHGLAALEGLDFPLPGGGSARLRDVAELRLERGRNTIRRSGRQRIVRIQANLDKEVTTPDLVRETLDTEVLPRLERERPGLVHSYQGRQKEQTEFLDELLRTTLLSLFAIFALLAIPLRSYLRPLIIMSAIPFGFVGALAGHLLLGLDLTMFSVIGLVALAGVVVNDSLVLLDYVTRLREDGMGLHDALLAAGRRRFRPILLTTLTTFLGLTPLLLERSLQAQFLIPMAVSLAFGVAFATAITLVLVPVLAAVLEDVHPLRWGLRRRLSRPGRTDPARGGAG